MMYFAWFLIAMYVFTIFARIALIGQQREPHSITDAILTLLIQGGLAIGVYYFFIA